MSNADIFVEMVRLTEQIGSVVVAHMYDNGFLTVDGKTKDGKKVNLSLIVKEEEKDGN